MSALKHHVYIDSCKRCRGLVFREDSDSVLLRTISIYFVSTLSENTRPIPAYKSPTLIQLSEEGFCVVGVSLTKLLSHLHHSHLFLQQLAIVFIPYLYPPGVWYGYRWGETQYKNMRGITWFWSKSCDHSHLYVAIYTTDAELSSQGFPIIVLFLFLFQHKLCMVHLQADSTLLSLDNYSAGYIAINVCLQCCSHENQTNSSGNWPICLDDRVSGYASSSGPKDLAIGVNRRKLA